MAEEQVGLGKEQVREPAPWTKIFTGFRVAADPKKLLLAAAGIFVMALGWWILAAFFYTFYSGKVPQWSTYEKKVSDKIYKDNDEAFSAYKQELNNWNLMHKLAGPASGTTGVEYTIADYTKTYDQFKAAKADLETFENDLKRGNRLLDIDADGDDIVIFSLDSIKLPFTYAGGKADTVKTALEKKVKADELVTAYNPATGEIKDLKGYRLKLATSAKDDWVKFEKFVTTKRQASDIRFEVKDYIKDKQEAALIALTVLEQSTKKHYKPAGWLATWPWFEYRGPNPYLVMTGEFVPATEPGGRAQAVLNWFYSQIPVLLEPLIKFLSPLIYFLQASYFSTRFYLLLVILWTIATWSLFGGAISRMASVQVARPTERVGLVEAVRFAISRYRSFVASQLLPFAFLAVLTLVLFLFGFFEILLPAFGDVIIAGLGFPLVLIMGLIMAVVLIGLTGWPLMYATISTEGSDSFDAISRSYSYVYQAPWQYIWYGFLTLVYGAALVFFVGLMGSLLVYLGKFGIGLPSGMWEAREPSYLYQYAPTSYGWRDLLLHQSIHATTQNELLNTGQVVAVHTLKQDYASKLAVWNNIGAGMVAFWLYLVFLMIIGFGYSFFWSASSIIYLLMRYKVDDTEMDEVHLEEEELDTPAFAPAAAPAAPAAAPGGRATVPLNVVEGPPVSPSPPVVATPAPPAPAHPSYTDQSTPQHGTPAVSGDMITPAGAPKKTQLAPGGGMEGEQGTTEGGGPQSS